MPLGQTDCLNLANLGTCGHSFNNKTGILRH